MTGKRGNFPQLPTIFQLFPTLYSKVTQGCTTENRLTLETFCKMLIGEVSCDIVSKIRSKISWLFFWGELNSSPYLLHPMRPWFLLQPTLQMKYIIIVTILFVIFLLTMSYINCVVLFWLSCMIYMYSFIGIFHDILATHQVFPVFFLIQYSILSPDLSGCWPFHVIFGFLIDNLKILFR